jgi:hypothetical protein
MSFPPYRDSIRCLKEKDERHAQATRDSSLRCAERTWSEIAALSAVSQKTADEHLTDAGRPRLGPRGRAVREPPRATVRAERGVLAARRAMATTDGPHRMYDSASHQICEEDA